MPFLFPEPSAREARPAWEQVPAAIVADIEKCVNDRIVAAETGWGGYSPGAVFIATLASGRKIFIKGSHPARDAHGAAQVRQEVLSSTSSPAITSVTPPVIGMVSDNHENDQGWILAIFDYIDTRPALPWDDDKRARAWDVLKKFHSGAAAGLPDARTRNYVEKFLKAQGGWLRLRDEPQTRAKFLTVFDDAEVAGAWCQSALPALCALQEKVPALAGVSGPLHQDLRSDNFLFAANGDTFLIDWPNACYGPVALDLAQLLPAMMAEGGGHGDDLLKKYIDATGIDIPVDDVMIALASISGHLADNVYRAVPEKLPRLRWMQKSLLWSSLVWMADRGIIAHPPRFSGMVP